MRFNKFLPLGRTNFQVCRFRIGVNIMGSNLFNWFDVFAFLVGFASAGGWLASGVSSTARLFFVSHILFRRLSARWRRSILNCSWIRWYSVHFGRFSYPGIAASRARLHQKIVGWDGEGNSRNMTNWRANYGIELCVSASYPWSVWMLGDDLVSILSWVLFVVDLRSAGNVNLMG